MDGKILSEKIYLSLRERIKSLQNNGIVPGLGVILIGDNLESKKYISAKKRKCLTMGLTFKLAEYGENTTEDEIIKSIELFNNDSKIHGILIQLPLPKSLNKEKLLDRISPIKDVDGFHIINAGRLFLNRRTNFVPCTPLGCMELLDHYGITIEGRNVVIIGCSNIVGLPLSMMLLQRGATITMCHIKTENIKDITLKADLLISCCGVPHLINSDWIKEGVDIIDIGINILDNNKLVGDVNFEDVKYKCRYITPVPGGVGPMTIAMLIKQTIESAENLSRL